MLGVADPQAQGGGGAVSAAKARVSDTLALDPAPALGFDGAAALDAQGRLAGIAALKVRWSRGPAPTPCAAQRSRRSRRSARFLDAQNVAPGDWPP